MAVVGALHLYPVMFLHAS